ncbi:MAG: sterol desaturase family protein [Schleiferiaceae bacterium]|nr:sterol desaturase family protein [Schleiferiaceae bacterium]
MEYQLALPILDQYAPWVLGGLALILLILELYIPLRKRKQEKWDRWRQNISLSLIGLPAARLLLLPITFMWAGFVTQEGFGLINWLPAPGWLQLVLGMLALDYGIYVWHRLNHVFPFLWRFHNVHHVDRDMDLSTGIRFHIGELVMSIPFRFVVIGFFGVGPVAILVYEIIFEAATLFHHSNWRLPRGVERLLAFFIITPRQHGIHHSKVKEESDSNYGTVLNWWDKLHRSSRMNIPQDKVEIGIPGYEQDHDHSVLQLLKMPFQKPRPWQKTNGEVPRRAADELDAPLR